FFAGFVLVPGSLGALLCLGVVNVIPRRPKQFFILAAILVAVGIFAWGFGTFRSAWRSAFVRANMERLLEQSSVWHSPLLPGNWMARGLMAAARGEPGEALFQLALVSSNGLFLYLLTAWTARRFYRRGYNRMVAGMMFRKRYRGVLLDRVLSGLAVFLSPQTR